MACARRLRRRRLRAGKTTPFLSTGPLRRVWTPPSSPPPPARVPAASSSTPSAPREWQGPSTAAPASRALNFPMSSVGPLFSLGRTPLTGPSCIASRTRGGPAYTPASSISTSHGWRTSTIGPPLSRKGPTPAAPTSPTRSTPLPSCTRMSTRSTTSSAPGTRCFGGCSPSATWPPTSTTPSWPITGPARPTPPQRGSSPWPPAPSWPTTRANIAAPPVAARPRKRSLTGPAPDPAGTRAGSAAGAPAVATALAPPATGTGRTAAAGELPAVAAVAVVDRAAADPGVVPAAPKRAWVTAATAPPTRVRLVGWAARGSGPQGASGPLPQAVHLAVTFADIPTVAHVPSGT